MRTTKADFDYFKKRCIHWAKEFGLNEWEFVFEHVALDLNSQARWEVSPEGKWCIITLDVEWSTTEKKRKQSLNRIAFHEICEVSLYPLRRWAGKLINIELLNEETHTIVRRMENLMLGFET